jgi:hypothetical protein
MASTRLEPMKPAAPVMSSFMGFGCWGIGLSGVLNSFECYAVDFKIFSLINGDDLNNLFKFLVFINNADFSPI